MARNKKLYSYTAVSEYLDGLKGVDIDIIPGCLIDTYIIYHKYGVVEVMEETYINPWESAYTRHIYRKGLPTRYIKELEDLAREEEKAV